jgi:hypothetical protein
MLEIIFASIICIGNVERLVCDEGGNVFLVGVSYAGLRGGVNQHVRSYLLMQLLHRVSLEVERLPAS